MDFLKVSLATFTYFVYCSATNAHNNTHTDLAEERVILSGKKSRKTAQVIEVPSRSSNRVDMGDTTPAPTETTDSKPTSNQTSNKKKSPTNNNHSFQNAE